MANFVCRVQLNWVEAKRELSNFLLVVLQNERQRQQQQQQIVFNIFRLLATCHFIIHSLLVCPPTSSYWVLLSLKLVPLVHSFVMWSSKSDEMEKQKRERKFNSIHFFDAGPRQDAILLLLLFRITMWIERVFNLFCGQTDDDRK